MKGMEENSEIAVPKSLAGKVHCEEDAAEGMQIGLFANANNAVIDELKELDVNTLTPIEALTKLYELKNKTI